MAVENAVSGFLNSVADFQDNAVTHFALRPVRWNFEVLNSQDRQGVFKWSFESVFAFDIQKLRSQKDSKFRLFEI